METQDIKDMLLDIKGKVDKIETTQNIQFERLFGNGQPGVIDKLDTRVAKLETFKDTSLGRHSVFMAFGSAIAVLVTELIRKFIRGG